MRSRPARSRLPESPALHFAEFLDTGAENRLISPAKPEARLVFWQEDVNEGEEISVEELDQRLQGLEAESAARKRAAAKGFSHRVFGRIQADAVTFSQDAANREQLGNIPNGTDFRRVRIGVQGEGHEIYYYRLEIGFAQADSQTKRRPRITDAYFEIRDLPWLGVLRVGQFREPISIERSTSGNDITFMERGLPQAFNPARRLGVMAFDHSANEKWYWWNGLFAQNSTAFGEQFGDAPRVAWVDRAVWLPWYDKPSEGRYLLQLGASYSYQSIRDQTRKFSSTPEVKLQYGAESVIPNFVNTGNLLMNDFQILQCEASTVLGPLSFQAEYYGVLVDQPGQPTVFLHGAYAFVSYFLTGENRVYDPIQGIYVATKPYSEFFRVRTDRGIGMGPGAWEIAARFSTINLSDGNVQGGRLNDVTLGVNWYLNFQSRIMFNYIHAFLNRYNQPSNADVFAMRAQVVW
ncbi:MAG TPA: porin [Pirellulales bacterium]|nr:porin [Pirellulales bacterium]